MLILSSALVYFICMTWCSHRDLIITSLFYVSRWLFYYFSYSFFFSVVLFVIFILLQRNNLDYISVLLSHVSRHYETLNSLIMCWCAVKQLYPLTYSSIGLKMHLVPLTVATILADAAATPPYQSDLKCVEWDVKPCPTQPNLAVTLTSDLLTSKFCSLTWQLHRSCEPG